jgi:hypothetical protein
MKADFRLVQWVCPKNAAIFGQMFATAIMQLWLYG